MIDEKLLIEKGKAIYEKSYFMMEKDFEKLVEESKVKTFMDTKEAADYNNGFTKGLLKGREMAFRMKERADGCCGCAFEDKETWEMPCEKCCRNNKDYWRMKTSGGNDK